MPIPTMSVRKTSIAAISLLLVLAGVRVASAQNAEAELLFRDGDRLMAAGDYPAACEAFEASNRIEPRAGTLIRLGACREKNGQLASAWSAYSDALARVKDEKKQRIAAAQLALLEPRLSQLAITVPDGSRVDGLTITRNGVPVDPALWNRGAPVDGGGYEVVATAPGFQRWSTVVDVAAEGARATVEVPRLVPEPRAPADPGPTPLPTGPRAGEPRDAPDGGMLTGRRKIAVGVAGAGAVALGGAMVLGMQAGSLEEEAHRRCPAIRCAEYDEGNDLLERSRARVRYANITYGVAGGLVVGAAVLWITGAPSDRASVSVVPAVSPDHAGAAVVGRF